jgi:hypothetical protein
VQSKLDAALQLAALGFPVFPLIPNGKIPAIENWQAQATTNPEYIKRWWQNRADCNVGVSTHRLLVVDIDPRHDGDKTFAALEMTESFAETCISTTPGGGVHLVYQLPEGVECKGDNRGRVLGQGIDIKSRGGFIAAPGSSIEGRSYAWGIGPDTQRIAEAPAWIVERCHKPREAAASAGLRVVEEDDVALERASTYVTEHAPYADEGQRDNTAFSVAARLFDFGVTRETAHELMLEWNEQNCHPPLDGEDLDRIVSSAMKNRGSAIGAAHPNAPGFEAHEVASTLPTPSGDARAAGLFTPLKRFAAAELPLRPWIVPGFACRARVTMLAGPGGVAKSTYTLMLAVAVAAGRDDICGFVVPTRQKVAVWNQEDDLEEMQRRLAAVMQEFNVAWSDIEGPNGEPMLYLNSGVDQPLMLALRTQEGSIVQSRQVKQAAAEIKAAGIGLVVLDPLVELHQAVENDNVQMRAVMATVRDIAVHGDCAVLLATHTRKPPGASSDGFAGDMDAARGASSQSGVIRVGATLFSASPKDAKAWRMQGNHLDFVRLDVAKNNLGPLSGQPMWFRRASVEIGGMGGESVGVLTPVDLKRREVVANVNLLEVIAGAMAGAGQTGRWYVVADVIDSMDETSRAQFPEQSNRARTIREAFDGAERYATNYGILRFKVMPGRRGIIFRLDADANASNVDLDDLMYSEAIDLLE